MLSNCHSTDEDTVKQMMKKGAKENHACLKMITTYNSIIGSVDSSDQHMYDMNLLATSGGRVRFINYSWLRLSMLGSATKNTMG